jgi:hypothetical protein
VAPNLKSTVPEDTYTFQAYYPGLISEFNVVLGLKTFYQAAILEEMTPEASLILCYQSYKSFEHVHILCEITLFWAVISIIFVLWDISMSIMLYCSILLHVNYLHFYLTDSQLHTTGKRNHSALQMYNNIGAHKRGYNLEFYSLTEVQQLSTSPFEACDDDHISENM